MKDIHEVKDIQPALSFNHVHCRGMAARVRSVHLICSIDQKLGWKGGGKNTPTAAPSCFSRTAILQEILTNNRKPTGRPQTMPIVQHSLDNTKRHTMTSMTFHHTPTTTTQPAQVDQIHDPPPHNQNLSHTDRLSFSQTVPAIPPGSSTTLTDRTRREGLCQTNGGGVTKVKGHTEWRPRPPHSCDINSAHKTSTAPESEAQLEASKPASITHTCTAHGQPGMPTRQIRVNCF